MCYLHIALCMYDFHSGKNKNNNNNNNIMVLHTKNTHHVLAYAFFPTLIHTHTYIISSFHLIKRAPKQKHEKIYKHILWLLVC